MALVSRDELRELMETRLNPSVSIFLPTHRAGKEIQQDPIRLKNLLTEAEKSLIAGGMRTPDARDLLAPASSLLEDGWFWRHQSDGLAIFLNQDLSRSYRLPLEFAELLVVSDNFHIKPLLPLISGDGDFYILALSQNENRLMEGTRYGIDQVNLENVPESMAEALRFDLTERQLQYHTKSSPKGGQRDALYHGQGTVSNGEKEDILRYFRQVNEGIQELLQNETAPLILAGVDYLLPIYHEANTYPHLIETGIEGNPEALSPQELHERAWEKVEPYFQQDIKKAVGRYKQVANSEQASKDLSETILTAFHGGVDTLFVRKNAQRWGHFDPESNTLDLHTSHQPGDEDLLDTCAVHTYINGGKVYVVESDKMPADGSLAAIFRYEVPSQVVPKSSK